MFDKKIILEALKELNEICNDSYNSIEYNLTIKSKESNYINDIIETYNLNDKDKIFKLLLIVDDEIIFDSFNTINIKENIQNNLDDKNKYNNS